MSLMDIFRSKPVETGPVKVEVINQPQQQPGTGNGLVPGNNAPVADGSITAFPATGTGEKSPLENYVDLWQAPDPKTTRPPASLEVTVPADMTKMMETARTIDFTKAIPKEVLDKALAGDSAAMMAALNATVQASFAQAAGVTAKIVEGALTAQGKKFHDEILPAALKKAQVADSLRTDNPTFNSPAVSPLIAIVEAQMQLKHPDASPAEITKKAKEYVLTASEHLLGDTKVISDKPTAGAIKKNTLARESEDWSKFFAA